MFSLAACATGAKTAFHSFSFGNYGENPDIEVLNYQYGSSKLSWLRPDENQLKAGHIGQRWDTSGVFPVGDFLYVRWRVKSTDLTYDDTVDLTNKLPSNMNNQRIHFLINGPQLYIYIISDKAHAPGEPDCPVNVYHIMKCAMLYPEHQ